MFQRQTWVERFRTTHETPTPPKTMTAADSVRAFVDFASHSNGARVALSRVTTPEEVVAMARRHRFDIDVEQVKQSLLLMPMRTLFEAGLDQVMVSYLGRTSLPDVVRDRGTFCSRRGGSVPRGIRSAAAQAESSKSCPSTSSVSPQSE